MTESNRTLEPSDYIIVGGGSAGAVVANRLSEDPNTRVVLIEAGGEAKSFLVQMPAGCARLIANKEFDWRYEQDPDPSINGRRYLWSAGKLLGGGSSINGCVYIRGTRRDYDRWAQAGATGWGFDDVMPFFRRSEHWTGTPNPAHGSSGPLTVSPMRPGFDALCLKFVEGCNQFGIKTLDEYNGGDMEGVFLTQASQRDGWRCSTEKGYLRPARSRPNLRVITGAEVEKIRFDGRRAVGVTFVHQSTRQAIDARREVIVSAGAMGSPALLMRSGVGSGEYLRSKGIDVVHELPDVGRNLQEQPGVGQNKYVNVPTLNSRVGPLHVLSYLARFLLNRSGPLASPAVPVMGLARTREGLDEPDVQIHFMPVGSDIEQDTVSWDATRVPKEPIVSLYASICHPKSRGHVELGTDGRPRIIHQMLGDERDIETLVGGAKLINRIFQTPALRSIVTGDRIPKSIPETDADWVAYVRAQTAPGYHAAGTCRMGSDANAVVDPQLRVNGLQALRVIDASVMPTLPSTNTNATAIMIGEKGAELVRTSRTN